MCVCVLDGLQNFNFVEKIHSQHGKQTIRYFLCLQVGNTPISAFFGLLYRQHLQSDRLRGLQCLKYTFSHLGWDSTKFDTYFKSQMAIEKKFKDLSSMYRPSLEKIERFDEILHPEENKENSSSNIDQKLQIKTAIAEYKSKQELLLLTTSAINRYLKRFSLLIVIVESSVVIHFPVCFVSYTVVSSQPRRSIGREGLPRVWPRTYHVFTE